MGRVTEISNSARLLASSLIQRCSACSCRLYANRSSSPSASVPFVPICGEAKVCSSPSSSSRSVLTSPLPPSSIQRERGRTQSVSTRHTPTQAWLREHILTNAQFLNELSWVFIAEEILLLPRRMIGLLPFAFRLKRLLPILEQLLAPFVCVLRVRNARCNLVPLLLCQVRLPCFHDARRLRWRVRPREQRCFWHAVRSEEEVDARCSVL